MTDVKIEALVEPAEPAAATGTDTMKRKQIFDWLLPSVFLSSLIACSAGESAAIPNDFKLSAEYKPGFSNWKPWKLTVTADGKAIQEVGATRNGKESATNKTSMLTTKQLQELVATVQSAQFFKLKRRYTYNVTDNPTLTLRVLMNSSSQEVVVYAPGHLNDNEDVKRFLKLWNEVLEKVPAPNADQKLQ